jgi:IS1 family transposase
VVLRRLEGKEHFNGKAEGCGDCWTWTALDADTKLMISFRLGDRTLATAYDFMHDVAGGSRIESNWRPTARAYA